MICGKNVIATNRPPGVLWMFMIYDHQGLGDVYFHIWKSEIRGENLSQNQSYIIKTKLITAKMYLKERERSRII